MSIVAKKYYEASLKFLKAGRFAEAEAKIAEAIAADEQNAEYWLTLGQVWATQRRYQEARDTYQMAATLAPTHHEALYGLGLCQLHLGETNSGLESMEKAFAATTTKRMSIDLSDFFAIRGDSKLAAYYLLKGRKAHPQDADIQSKLAYALYQDGDTTGAVMLLVDLILRYPKNISYINIAADIYRKVDHNSFDDRAYQAILICLRTENVKYRHFAPAWASLFLLNPAYAPLRDLPENKTADITSLATLLSDEFINIGLKNLPILSPAAEKILQGIRGYFLLNRANASLWPKETLTFLTSLAVQGWYNDFVFYEPPEEISELKSLEIHAKSIAASVTEGTAAEAMMLALYACYRPLYTIKPHGNKLPLGKSALYEMRPLIKAQIQNPEREQEIIPTIPHFTDVTDDVSRAVQDMYAKRPYPRWKSTLLEIPRAEVADLSRGMEILVAGCGTGQEPSMYATSTPYARVTAIDLSLPSIAYGKRMAEEIGYASKIDFMHGDLMDVGKIGRSFDYVVSSGVLHHMKEPEKGWQAILKTMKPGGRMNISLYSKIARDQNLGPASHYIQEKGYSSSDADIRQFRRDVMDMPSDDPIRRCARASDFYMLSECNDLLFHVQEHRMTCTTLKQISERLGLELIHVYMPPKYLKLWKEKHPDNPKFDFDRLNTFEQENPDLFLEMYKLYFRRQGDTSRHPFDPLILAGLV